MLHVVTDACQLARDNSRGEIVVESDLTGPPFVEAFHELGGVDARHLALTYAAQAGLTPANLNGNTVGPYPVNGDGVPLDMVQGPDGLALPPTHPKMQVKRYRVTIPVIRAGR